MPRDPTRIKKPNLGYKNLTAESCSHRRLKLHLDGSLTKLVNRGVVLEWPGNTNLVDWVHKRAGRVFFRV